MRESINKITDYLSNKFPFTFQEIVIDPFDFEQIYEILNETIKLEDIINVTGGTKIMAIAAFQVAMEKEIASLYVDTTNQRLIMLGQDKGEQKYYSISSLRVNQYIELFSAILEEQTSF